MSAPSIPGTAPAEAPAQRRRGSRLDAVLPERWVDRRQRSRVDEVFAGAGHAVLAGPFAGMTLAAPALRSGIPKLLGSYEAELHSVLDRVLGRGPELVVHVGCAEGYYAVGIARAVPRARVIGFDVYEEARTATLANADANGVAERVAVRDRCFPETLAMMLTVPSLVIVDAESAHLDVVTAPTAPGLSRADLVIELRVGAEKPTVRRLVDPLRATHQLAMARARPRDPGDYPYLAALTPAQQQLALAETRDAPREWLVALAHSRPDAS